MKKKGFTLIEVTIVIAVMVVIGAYVILSLSGRKKEFDIRTTSQQIATALRFAQSKSMMQASSTAWGVHFDNTSAEAPFYVLFASSTYGAAVESDNRMSLPKGVYFDTSTVPEAGSKDISFAIMSGQVSSATGIRIYLQADPSISSTISVALSGVVSY